MSQNKIHSTTFSVDTDTALYLNPFTIFGDVTCSRPLPCSFYECYWENVMKRAEILPRLLQGGNTRGPCCIIRRRRKALNADHNSLSPGGRSKPNAVTDTVTVFKISNCDSGCRVRFSPTLARWWKLRESRFAALFEVVCISELLASKFTTISGCLYIPLLQMGVLYQPFRCMDA